MGDVQLCRLKQQIRYLFHEKDDLGAGLPHSRGGGGVTLNGNSSFLPRMRQENSTLVREMQFPGGPHFTSLLSLFYRRRRDEDRPLSRRTFCPYPRNKSVTFSPTATDPRAIVGIEPGISLRPLRSFSSP